MNDLCPMGCQECSLLGDKVPDWPRRKMCRKLDEKLKSQMEDEGGLVVEEAEQQCTCELGR